MCDYLINAMNIKILSLLRTVVVPMLSIYVLLPAHASTVEYYYVEHGTEKGKCLDINRKPGLNPGYFGDCGNLEGQDLKGKKFERISMRGAKLTRADFTDSTFVEVDLEGANLNDSSFIRSSFYKVNFKSALLWRVRAFDSTFISSSFEFANLSSAKLLNSRFEYSVFTGAKLLVVEAIGSSFAAVVAKSIIAVGSNFSKSSFSGAQLDDSNFTGSNLNHANFSKVVSSGMNLNKVSCTGTDFSHTRFSQFNMIEAKCADVNFEEMRWSFGNLFRTKIIGFRGNLGEIGDSIMIDSVIEDSSDTDEDQYFALYENDLRNAKIKLDGLSTSNLQFSVFGPGTVHPFSPEEIAQSKIFFTDSTVAVEMLIPSEDEWGAWIRHPLEVLKNIVLQPRAIDSLDEIRNQLLTAEVYIVPFLFERSRFKTPEVAELFREFLKKPNKRLILLGPNDYFLKELKGDSFYNARYQGYSNSLDIDQRIANTFNLPGLNTKIPNNGFFRPYLWSRLPLKSQVLYGDSVQDSAYVIRLPFENSEIWSVPFSYGNAGFGGDDMKAAFYRILKTLALAKPNQTRLLQYDSKGLKHD